MEAKLGRFQRFVLPGLAFKAVVIGGGYATGRELAEFFLPSGPRGALLGMALAALLCSLVCAATFAFAYTFAVFDYRSFFKRLLGWGWVAFEVGYLCLLMLMLSVFSAAAGAIAATVFGAPAIIGSLLLALAIAAAASFGNRSVEAVFKWVSILLYGTYALFVALSLAKFGGRVAHVFASYPLGQEWWSGGLSYAGYNVVGVTAVLSVVRHMTSRRDAVVAGLLCGPLALAPAALFLLSMSAFYPEVRDVALPSDFILAKLGIPAFHIAFQIMILAALLESGTGGIHAINERIDGAVRGRGRAFGPKARFSVGLFFLLTAAIVADRVGLIALIARGYRGLALLFLILFVIPVLTIGTWRVWRHALIDGAVPDNTETRC